MRTFRSLEVQAVLHEPEVRCSKSPFGIHKARRIARRVTPDDFWFIGRCEICESLIWRSTSQNPIEAFAGLWHVRDEMTDFIILEQP